MEQPKRSDGTAQTGQSIYTDKNQQIETTDSCIAEKPQSLKNDRDSFFENIEKGNVGFLFGRFGNVPDETVRREAKKFAMYWTETDMRGKPRWKKQPTFEPMRRFATWIYRTCEGMEASKPKRIIV